VNASVGYTLPANVEILFLVGSAVAGTGNALANRIYGNAAANRLSGLGGDDSLLGGAGADTLAGGSGIDTLEGGTGNDVYVVANRTDVVVETSTLATEVDRVESTVSWTLGPNLERLTLLGSTAIDGTGNTRANVLVGNVAINRLAGGAGNDRIDGRAGNDSLTGGSGLDAFLFSTAPGATNIDRLADFNPADDRILLDDAVFAALAPGALPAAAFHDRAVATEAAHRILYDEVGGRLLYDADGAGGAAAVVFATLAPNLAVGAADFFVV
jgi:Ca2+-binding RTX toxin-like protein